MLKKLIWRLFRKVFKKNFIRFYTSNYKNTNKIATSILPKRNVNLFLRFFRVFGRYAIYLGAILIR